MVLVQMSTICAIYLWWSDTHQTVLSFAIPFRLKNHYNEATNRRPKQPINCTDLFGESVGETFLEGVSNIILYCRYNVYDGFSLFRSLIRMWLILTSPTLVHINEVYTSFQNPFLCNIYVSVLVSQPMDFTFPLGKILTYAECAWELLSILNLITLYL